MKWKSLKESDALEQSKKCGRLRRSGEDSSISEGQDKEKKDLDFRIMKLRKEIGQGDFKVLIIDRSKTKEEIDSQIDVSTKQFQKLESPEGVREGDNQFSEGEGMFCRGGPLGGPLSGTMEEDDAEKAERPKKKRREKAETLEVELDLSGKSHRGICRDRASGIKRKRA